jgi:hypothetical protein
MGLDWLSEVAFYDSQYRIGTSKVRSSKDSQLCLLPQPSIPQQEKEFPMSNAEAPSLPAPIETRTLLCVEALPC